MVLRILHDVISLDLLKGCPAAIAVELHSEKSLPEQT
jgi:hypothetical protein